MSRINFKPNASTIFINCRIYGNTLSPNDNRDAKLILDTGATHTVITPNTISGLGYENDIEKPQKTLPMATASGIISCPMIKVSNFRCMGQIVKDLEIGIYELPLNEITDIQIQGLLGMNFLNKFNYKITFSKGVIEISKPKQPNQNRHSRKKSHVRKNRRK